VLNGGDEYVWPGKMILSLSLRMKSCKCATLQLNERSERLSSLLWYSLFCVERNPELRWFKQKKKKKQKYTVMLTFESVYEILNCDHSLNGEWCFTQWYCAFNVRWWPLRLNRLHADEIFKYYNRMRTTEQYFYVLHLVMRAKEFGIFLSISTYLYVSFTR